MRARAIPTVADLKGMFAEHGVRPNRRLGQNFLVDPAIMRFIIHAASLDRRDVVLEPGAGTGGLTRLLSARAGRVVAVEIDRKLHAVAAEALAAARNVELVRADIMGHGETIAPVVRESMSAALASMAERRLKVVANLPYCISTALISALLHGGPIPEEMVVTVQRDVAERICAAPGSRDYGYLSVIVQAVAQVERLKTLSPKVFWPQPEVESGIIRVHPDARQCADRDLMGGLRSVASGLFRHRRKQVVKALIMLGLADGRDEAVEHLAGAGIPLESRPETIGVTQFIELARRLKSGRDS